MERGNKTQRSFKTQGLLQREVIETFALGGPRLRVRVTEESANMPAKKKAKRRKTKAKKTKAKRRK